MKNSGARRWWALGAVSLAVLAVGLDGTVLSVALPTLSKALKASESDLQWFTSIYLLVLAASRNGDFESLLKVLDPDIIFRIDPVLVTLGEPTEIRGARTVASNALAYASRTSVARVALVNGEVGMILAPRGTLRAAGLFVFDLDRQVIAAVELIAEPRRLHALEVAILSD